MTTVVVGAGIIGTAIAHDLQRRGHQVVLLDRDSPGRGASYGNMASIAVTEFMPASRPSVWKQIPGWLLDPEGPVRVRPSSMPRLVPWFLRFVAASRQSRLRDLEAQGAALCSRALDDTLALLRETEMDAAPDYRRSKITVKRAKEALPNLVCEDFTEWMGHRPALPDTVPILSVSAKTKGLFYATGHGHLGLTYAATTARLMGELVTGIKPSINLRPYRVDRF